MTWRRIGALATAVVLGSGVTVVVDFGNFGGVQIGCASGSPSSGLAALQGAGFGYSFVPNQPGLVCRISGLPDPCNGAPTEAYWSYWYADRGGSWTYSSLGAGNRTPPPGSVEGWAFGAGGQPGKAPPAPPAPPPEPPPRPKPPPPPPPAAPAPPPGAPEPPPHNDGGGSSTGSGVDRPPRDNDGAGEPERPPSGGTSAGPTGGTPGGAGAGGTASGTSPPSAGEPAPVARTSAGSGGVTGVVVAAALVAALGTAAFWLSRRRAAYPLAARSAASDPEPEADRRAGAG